MLTASASAEATGERRRGAADRRLAECEHELRAVCQVLSLSPLAPELAAEIGRLEAVAAALAELASVPCEAHSDSVREVRAASDDKTLGRRLAAARGARPSRCAGSLLATACGALAARAHSLPYDEVALRWIAPGAESAADPATLGALFANLLDNAVRHGHGSLRIAIAPAPTDRGRSFAAVEVANTVAPHGAGGSAARVRPRRGGLGLRIAADAVRRVGGALTARDEAGEFRVRALVPLRPNATRPRPATLPVTGKAM